MSPDETYPSRLKVHLELNEDKISDVINGGHGRYSPYQSFLLLKHFLLKYDPDSVIVAIYVGNDFADLLRFDDRPSLTLVDDTAVKRAAKYILYDKPPLPTWSNNSIIYALYREHFKFYKDRVQYLIELNKELGGSFADSLSMTYTFFKIKNQEIISQTLAQTIFFDRYPGAQRDSITLMKTIIDMHNQLAKKNNYQVSYLILPSKVQIEPHLDNDSLTRAYELASLNTGIGETDDELANELRLYLENNNLSFVDRVLTAA